MRTLPRISISCAIAAAIIALSYLPLPYSNQVFWPGDALASIVWPAGIHSDFRSDSEFVAMLATFWGATFLAWSVLAYAALGFVRSRRSA